MTGFDSVEECFREYSHKIHAIETGLSSDPAMNWRISKLDKYTLLSSSDAHSHWPWRLGREANVFDIDWKYDDLMMPADREEGFVPDNSIPFRNIISLSEVIGGTIGNPVSSRKVWEEYYKLINVFGNEFNVLLYSDESSLKKITAEKIAENIIKNRNQKIHFKPGYDGVYGTPLFDGSNLQQKQKFPEMIKQSGLAEFIG